MNKAIIPSVLEQEVQQAMDCLDPQLSKEYYRALEVIPNLVCKETRIADFLEVDQNDPRQAATRLALYWKSRKELFGERWLLPMTQTGTGEGNNTSSSSSTASD